MKWFVKIFHSVIKATNNGDKNFTVGLDEEDRSLQKLNFRKLLLLF